MTHADHLCLCCKAGKHEACDSTTWCSTSGHPVICRCWYRSHAEDIE